MSHDKQCPLNGWTYEYGSGNEIPKCACKPNTVTISREVYAWFKELAETSPRNIPVFVLDEIAKQRGGGQK